MDLEDASCRVQFLIRDRDGKFPGLFDTVLKDAGATVVLGGIQNAEDEFDHGMLRADVPA